MLHSILVEPAATTTMMRCIVSAVRENGEIVCADRDGNELNCEVLQHPGTQDLEPGHAVLVWVSLGPEISGVIMGRVGLHAPAGAERDSAIPEQLVLEARSHISLKVGQGSITIGEDGRILIKGRDLVSHAKRMNRIRGGSVEIN